MKLVHGFYGMYTQNGVTFHFAAPHKEIRHGVKTVIVPPKESEVAEGKTVYRLHPSNLEE